MLNYIITATWIEICPRLLQPNANGGGDNGGRFGYSPAGIRSGVEKGGHQP
jgi:hypothetical protein